MTTKATGPDVLAASGELSVALNKLEATRHELRRFQFWLGLASVLLAEAALGAAFLLADWMWVLPLAVRAGGLVAMAAMAPYLINRLRRPLDPKGSAAAVEAHFPELGQRLRTVVEYAQPAPDTAPAAPGLLRALGQDTDRRASGLDFRVLVPWTAFEWRAVVLFFAAAIGLFALFMNSDLRTAALRMLLLPRHYTSLKVEPGDLILRAGQDLELNARISGRPVASASWSYRENVGGGAWITTSLATDPAPGNPHAPLIGSFSASLKDRQANFDYRVVAGDVESPIFHVKVVHPLVMRAIEATITPPPYTRRPVAVVKEGSFRAIEGSRAQIAITLDRLPKKAELVWGSPEDSSRQSIALRIDGPRLTGELPPIVSDIEYEIAAADAQGMKLEPESYRVKVEADDKPTIRFIRPEESLAVTPTTEVPIQVEAGDDFGVARLGISYKLGDGPEETLHFASFADQPITAQGLATLYLEKHKLGFTDAITYHAFAEDNYPVKPHRVVSELRYIDILPYKHEYRFVEGQEGSSESSMTLEELIARQRVNLSRTFFLERDRSINDAAVMRLATFEEELATATAEFSEGLKTIGGQVPSLDDAVSAMRSAILSLDTKEVAAARAREETALKWLISARRNLQKLLTQANSSQASACRKYDRERVQKIRRPRQDNSELAELEEDLRELAQREQDFSEQIEARGGGGAELDSPPPDGENARSSQEPTSEPSTTAPNPAGPKSSSKDAQARSDPVQEQKQAAAEAERLRQLARHDDALTELAIRRLDAAAQSVRESSRSIEAGDRARAAQEARAAARKLESAARQVGALKARELTDRLARQRDLAEAIARAERALGQALLRTLEPKEGAGHESQRSAEKQNELADDVAALADALEQLTMAAAQEQPELALNIGRATKTNPPEEVEESMRKTAGAIGNGHAGPASRAAEHAASQLDALAQELESVRRAAVQPQLDRLLAAEKQAAALQEMLRSVKQASQRAEAERSLSDLARVLENLAPGAGPLREAADNLNQAARSNVSHWVRNDNVQPGEIGYFLPPVVHTAGVSAAMIALQAKIQEMVLDKALVERTGPVPPRYKNLVDDYYRVLSQDLR